MTKITHPRFSLPLVALLASFAAHAEITYVGSTASNQEALWEQRPNYGLDGGAVLNTTTEYTGEVEFATSSGTAAIVYRCSEDEEVAVRRPATRESGAHTQGLPYVSVLFTTTQSGDLTDLHDGDVLTWSVLSCSHNPSWCNTSDFEVVDDGLRVLDRRHSGEVLDWLVGS